MNITAPLPPQRVAKLVCAAEGGYGLWIAYRIGTTSVVQSIGFELGGEIIAEPVFLAPMAGVTDAPFRRQVAEFGRGRMVTEMIASGGWAARNPRIARKADGLTPGMGAQIAGRDPAEMAEAARRVAGCGASWVDINMGCPAKKVANVRGNGGLGGAALMREPELAARIVAAVAESVDLPVTVKMRLGWDAEAMDAPALAARLEDVGARMFVIHGRTRAQFYKGVADWRAVGAVTARVAAPVLVNGDIVDGASARAALAQSGADGVMVGRAATGAPWLLAEIAAAFSGESYQPPTAAARMALMTEHFEASIAFYGEAVGVRCVRKHLGERLAHIPGGAALRQRLFAETDAHRCVDIMREAHRRLDGGVDPAAAPAQAA